MVNDKWMAERLAELSYQIGSDTTYYAKIPDI